MSDVDWTLVDPRGAVVSDHFADFRGRTYRVRQADAHTMMLEMDARTAEDVLPGEPTEESDQGDVFVTVPKASLDRWFARRITAVWRGKYRVSVLAMADDRAYLYMPGASAALGTELGLTGDQYSGFYGDCPISELTHLQQQIEEFSLS